MFKMIRTIRKRMENRRKWNRTRRWMRENAYSRAITALYHSGVLRRDA